MVGVLKMVLLQFSWRRGSKDSRGQGFKGSSEMLKDYKRILISYNRLHNIDKQMSVAFTDQ